MEQRKLWKEPPQKEDLPQKVKDLDEKESVGPLSEAAKRRKC